MQFLQILSRTQFNTHAHTHTHTHLLQVSGTSSRWLHKAKKGEKSSTKKANAGAITLLRKKIAMKSVGGVEKGKEVGGGKLWTGGE